MGKLGKRQFQRAIRLDKSSFCIGGDEVKLTCLGTQAN